MHGPHKYLSAEKKLSQCFIRPIVCLSLPSPWKLTQRVIRGSRESPSISSFAVLIKFCRLTKISSCAPRIAEFRFRRSRALESDLRNLCKNSDNMLLALAVGRILCLENTCTDLFYQYQVLET